MYCERRRRFYTSRLLIFFVRLPAAGRARPSAADVRTQGQYQSMDRRFIGLIFSVFSEDKHSKVRQGGDKERGGEEGRGGGMERKKTLSQSCRLWS